MLRQEEFVQQPVDLQQALAVDGDEVAVHFEEAPVLQALNWPGEMRDGISAKFLLEPFTAHLAELELEDELADEALVGRRRQRAVERELAGVHGARGRAGSRGRSDSACR